MMKTSDSDAASSSSASEEVKYRGVRKRKWGKWVSEVRLPNSRERIWLGSYDSPRKAARAFDAAALCLRGSQARLNFPENPPQIPSNSRIMSHQQIQTVAAQHANSLVESPQLPSSPLPPTQETETSPELSGEVLMETTEELSFTEMMMMRDQFLGIDDDFMYDFDIPHVGPTTDAPADDGGSGFGTNSYLWNF